MKMHVDLRSVCFGGILTAVLFCLIGSVSFVQPEEFGRFQMVTNASHAFVLDSATGEVWSAAFEDTAGAVTAPDPNFHAEKLVIHVQ